MIVTDHALLRFMERVHGFDVASLRAQLAGHIAGHVASGCSSWRAPEATYCFREGRLVTVLPAGCHYRPQQDHS